MSEINRALMHRYMSAVPSNVCSGREVPIVLQKYFEHFGEKY
jgi:hypothetical protein